jgi:2-polyprenyl-3-methyl-5-hydroxy-6-metoxy-1,4-benzoquinol methylase
MTNDLMNLDKYLFRCLTCGVENAESLRPKIVATLKYLKSGDRNSLRDGQTLEQLWYASLIRNTEPWWNVYRDTDYLAELWACWIVYSKRYIDLIEKKIMSICDLSGIESIVDLGCGIGYSTARLKQLFPTVNVYAVEQSKTPQFRVCQSIAVDYDFQVVSEIDEIDSHNGLIFASEFFEHVRDPLDYLVEVVSVLNPRYLILANAFRALAVGHFDTYRIDEKWVRNTKVAKLFNLKLQSLGYMKHSIKLWNNRPNVWFKETGK